MKRDRSEMTEERERIEQETSETREREREWWAEKEIQMRPERDERWEETETVQKNYLLQVFYLFIEVTSGRNHSRQDGISWHAVQLTDAHWDSSCWLSHRMFGLLLEQILVTNWKHKRVHVKTDVLGGELGSAGDVWRFGELKIISDDLYCRRWRQESRCWR